MGDEAGEEGEGLMWKLIESAPKDGTQILLGWPRRHGPASGIVMLGAWLNIEYADISNPEGWWAWNKQLGFSKVGHMTHWMSLPEPPAVPEPEDV